MLLTIKEFDTSINLKLKSRIKVYQLATDKLMEDISAVATLVKSVHLGRLAIELICNELLFGCVLDDEKSVVLIEKKTIFDATISPEKTKRNHVLLQEDTSTYCVAMNTSSLVFAMREKADEDEEDDDLEQFGDEGEEQGYMEDEDQEDGSELSGEDKVLTPLHKKDFWMTNNIV